MKTYTTLDAIGDMFVIYGIVIVVSMLVAAVIRGIVWVLSRQATQAEAKAPAKPAPRATGPRRHPTGTSGGHHGGGRRDDGRAPHRPYRHTGSRLQLDRRGAHGPSHLARAARTALRI